MQQGQIRPSQLMSRRGFLLTFLGGLGAAWAGFLVQRRFLSPTTGEAKPVQVPLTELPVGGVKQITYENNPVLLMRSQEGVVAMSMVCTHLACKVQWQEAKQEFYCPCQQGKYDRNGEVISGPPPVPLERLPVKVVQEQVVVGEG
jgi:cytochrome b6-f complex iron-sulfur subunit